MWSLWYLFSENCCLLLMRTARIDWSGNTAGHKIRHKKKAETHQKAQLSCRRVQHCVITPCRIVAAKQHPSLHAQIYDSLLKNRVQCLSLHTFKCMSCKNTVIISHQNYQQNKAKLIKNFYNLFGCRVNTSLDKGKRKQQNNYIQ